MGNFAENLNLGNRFRPPPPDLFFALLFFFIFLMTNLLVLFYHSLTSQYVNQNDHIAKLRTMGNNDIVPKK